MNLIWFEMKFKAAFKTHDVIHEEQKYWFNIEQLFRERMRDNFDLE